ncbi:RNA-binding domain-containing protein [Microthyrium microscopicum]|uniref:RNA-binding domain-containing protein n=1 Tax=Microthyrium microscopicum TaxID=703497 RepID=A0A6A6UFN4_9PEZI|nr:RNA-binding domain-containing protein [Microthyrium microscopicum]
MADEDFEDDLFADVYADDAPPAPAQPSQPVAEPSQTAVNISAPVQVKEEEAYEPQSNGYDQTGGSGYDDGTGMGNSGVKIEQYQGHDEQDYNDDSGKAVINEDGKMFIGGLNWETSDDSLRSYFSQFGEVTECTVMRDGASGRSRGFGFLTFRDPKVVNTVVVKEHFLDGKIIDPKRAIPRDQQERTAKIFVGGVSPEASEQDFKQFFMQFGHVIDATLMMDKDTGRPRGFGFVTFDGDDAVDRALSQPLEIYGKMMEVKRAQPRSALAAEEQKPKFGRQRDNQFGAGRGNGESSGNFDQQGQMGGGAPGMGGGQAGISPAMMAKYWFNMQQYFKQMQTSMMAGSMGMPGGANYGGQGGPASWDGMYDDVPPPNGGGQGGRGGYGRGGYRGGRQQGTPPVGPSNAPINAPTGPKNAGRPGANYRGGGRGANRGFHPYSR